MIDVWVASRELDLRANTTGTQGSSFGQGHGKLTENAFIARWRDAESESGWQASGMMLWFIYLVMANTSNSY